MTMQMAIICSYGGHKSPTDFILDHEMKNLCISKLNIDVKIIRWDIWHVMSMLQ